MYTGRKIIVLTAVLVGTYLVVSHATEAGKLLTSGASAYGTAVRTLQGR